MNPVLVDALAERGAQREVTGEELVYAAGAFAMEFPKEMMELPVNPELSLSQVFEMRGIREWGEYVRAIEAASKRAGSWDIDFFDVKIVWEKYWKWMKKVREKFPELEWKKQESAISIIYSFGNKKLTVVYRVGEKTCSFQENKVEIGKGKAELLIDYVCADVLKKDTENCLLAKIRFFEGRTHETGEKAYRMLLERIKKNGYEREEDERKL